ncbi:MAG: hypothetical protein PHT03_07120 [Bacilli bacterium]|nr:hypothetical protein [Bacilli bacterium]
MKKVCLFLLFLTLLILVGCGNNTATQEKVESEEGYLGKYLEPVNVSMIKYIDPSAASNLATLTSITGETLTDNRWIRGYKNDLNLNISYSLTGSGNTFLTQWSGLMSTGNLPDIIAAGYADYEELATNNLIHDLSDVFDEYASPLLKTILDEAGPEAIGSVTLNKKIYGIPQIVSKYDSYKYLWIRRDWMENVGVYEAPKTIYELINLMDKFVNNDPDQNGKKDTYAFALSNDLWHNLEGFFACFGAYPDSWITDSETNKIKLGAIDNAMKEPLQLLQTMYKNKWLNQEFITLDYEKSKADVANGKTGIYMGAHYNASDFLLPSHNKDNNADWAAFPWPGKTEEEVVLHQLELGVNSILVVNKNFKNPEIAVKMLNYYYEKLYGETGNYDYWGNNQVDLIWAMGPLFSYRSTVNLVPYLDVQDYYQGKIDSSQLVGASKNYYKNIIIDKKYDWNIMFGKLPQNDKVSGGETAGYHLNKVVNGDYPTFTNAYTGAPTASMKIVGQQLGLDALQYFTKAIIGEKNATTDFDAFVAYWRKQGGDTMTNEINERIGR